MNDSLKTSLNAIREISSDIYHQYVPIIDSATDISRFAEPILTIPEVYNEFQSALINRLVYTAFEMKSFRNPLVILEGDAIPLGYAGQEVYTNPAKGRQYNANDFAGLLVKYEADVKVQYMAINMDVQYMVTFSRQQLKKAFTSWGDLEAFIDGLSNSLYNGAFIDEFRFTKNIVSSAVRNNMAVLEQVSAVSTQQTAKDFITKVRELYLNFQLPSTEYNAWAKVGGEGRPITTWTNPEDIVLLIRNDIRAYTDVEVLASAFNMDKSEFLANNIVTVDNFDVYDDEGVKVYDGSSIIGMIADKRWFRIKRQDMFMDSFYNPNNRSVQYYLNLIKMYNFSLFANGVVFVTSLPEVEATSISFPTSENTLVAGQELVENVVTIPATANTPAITIASSNSEVATATIEGKVATITAVGEGTATITLTAGELTATKSVTVTA